MYVCKALGTYIEVSVPTTSTTASTIIIIRIVVLVLFSVS